MNIVKSLLLLLALSFACPSHALESVKGYFRDNGTYVAPHFRSTADSTPYNNLGSFSNNAPRAPRNYSNPYSPRSSFSPNNSYGYGNSNNNDNDDN